MSNALGIKQELLTAISRELESLKEAKSTTAARTDVLEKLAKAFHDTMNA